MNKVLLIGPAGSGKTLKIIQRFTECIKTNKEVFLLVPNTSQVNHLKNIILYQNHLSGFFDSSIITFGDLFYLLGIPKKKVITFEKKSLLLRSIFESNIFPSLEEIKHYDGFLKNFSGLVKILKENLVYGKQDLEKSRLKNRIAKNDKETDDLSKAFLLYQEKLEKYGFLDYEDLLIEYMQSLESSKNLRKDFVLLVDGFNDFNELEYRILKRLFKNAEETFITLPFVPGKEKYRSFYQVSKKTYEKLIKYDFEIIQLKKKYRTNKFCLNLIEENIFSGKSKKDLIDGNDDSLNIIEALNMNDEINIIGRIIIKYVKTGDYKFSDFVLIARDVEKYIKYFEKSFNELEIPFRIYSNQFDYSGEVFNYLFSILDFFAEGWKDNLVLNIIKSGYHISERKKLWEIEKEYLLQGEFNSEFKWFNFAEKIGIPEFSELLKFLKELSSEIVKNDISGYIRIIERMVKNILLKDFQGNESFSTEADNILPDKEFSENMNVMLFILDELKFLEKLNPGKQISFPEFYSNFKQILSNTKKLKKDKRDNVVNIIDALEARQWEIPVVFVIGLIEKGFPRYENENVLLRETGFSRFSGSKEETINLEKYLFYICVTRAKEKLFLSYPSSDDDDNNTIQSIYLKEILKVLSERDREIVKRDFSKILTEKELFVHVDDILKYLSLNITYPFNNNFEDNQNILLLVKFYNSILNNSIENIINLKDNIYKSGSIIPKNIESPTVLSKIQSETKKISSSDFNNLVQCKYKFYGSRILNLENLPDIIERGLDNKTLGIIAHEVLKNANSEFNIDHLGYIFEKEVKKFYKKERLNISEEKLINNLYEYLKHFIEKEIKIFKETNFKSVGFEWQFGKSKLNRLTFDIPDIEEIYITGRVDRIDKSNDNNNAFIIDFKYKDNFFDKTKQEQTYSGKDIQLFLYMLAVERYLKLNSIGCAYYSIKGNNRKGIKFVENFNLTKDIKLEFIDKKKWKNRCVETLNSYMKDFFKGLIIAYPDDKDLCGLNKCDFYPLCRIQKWNLEA